MATMTRHPSNFGSMTQRPASDRGALADASIGWNGIRTTDIVPPHA
jgi:hypothetical protein